MNLEQLKAKYANNNTVAPTANVSAKAGATVGTTAGKVWDVTKKTGNTVADVMPATRGSVKNLAAELNSQLNDHDFELFKHELYIQMIAQRTQTNLPEEDVVRKYYEQHLKEEEAKAKAEAEANKPVQSDEDMVAAVVGKVLSSLGLVKKEEEAEEAPAVSPAFTPEQLKYLEQMQAKAPKSEEEEAEEVAKEEVKSTIEADKEARRQAAAKKKKEQEAKKEEAPKQEKKQAPKQGSKKKKPGRRRLGRQEPLAE